MRFFNFLSGVVALAGVAGVAASPVTESITSSSSSPTSLPTSATQSNGSSISTSATQSNGSSSPPTYISPSPSQTTGSSASSSYSSPSPSATVVPITSHDGFFSPNSRTIWTARTEVSVTWNISEIHDKNDTLAFINLYHADDDYPLPISHLAVNFPSNNGVFNVTVPDVDSGCYIIKIKSDCGCKSWRSEVFTINKPPPHSHSHSHSHSHTKPSPSHTSPAPTSPVPISGSVTFTSSISTPSIVPPGPPPSPTITTSNGGQPIPTQTITSPNQDTVWIVGTKVNITFNEAIGKNEDGVLKSINLYAVNGKTPVASLDTNFQSNTGSVTVTVPLVVNGTYYIEINSFRSESWSSDHFTIENSAAPPSGQPITSPNNSTVWTAGSTVTVTFDPSAVKYENGTLASIELYAATAKTAIATLTTNFQSNTGSVNVTVPQVPSGVYHILIHSYDSQTWESDSFSIQAAGSSSSVTASSAASSSPAAPSAL